VSVTAVLAPKAGLTAEDCTISEWTVTVGGEVSAGQPIAVVETYKATIEVLAPCDGVLLAALEPGDVVPSGATIGVVGTPGEDPVGLLDARVGRVDPAPPRHAPREARPRASGARRMSSPAARKLAVELGVELSSLNGTGPGGRITIGDVEAAANRSTEVDEAAAHASQNAPLSPMRKAITASTTASAHIPQFTLDGTAECRNLLAARDRLAERGLAVTVTDLVVAATAAVLPTCPQLAPPGSGIDLGIVVALDDGMLIPVVRHADRLGIDDIHREVGRLADAARAGVLSDSDISGGQFAISNLGSGRVERFTALLPPGYRGVLAVGSITTRPYVVADAVVPRPQMALTITCDHRTVDGVTAARFMSELCARLEDPNAVSSPDGAGS
jgi:pyruvate/2-oxoglutarate dehydrogenase complex dihydrolipoamide acyltransferase (E2) component